MRPAAISTDRDVSSCQHLREFAGLTKSVTVVGSNNHAEFWDSARWDEICPLEALPENIAAVMEELDF